MPGTLAQTSSLLRVKKKQAGSLCYFGVGISADTRVHLSEREK
jgi:hypothetical protein